MQARGSAAADRHFVKRMSTITVVDALVQGKADFVRSTEAVAVGRRLGELQGSGCPASRHRRRWCGRVQHRARSHPHNSATPLRRKPFLCAGPQEEAWLSHNALAAHRSRIFVLALDGLRLGTQTCAVVHRHFASLGDRVSSSMWACLPGERESRRWFVYFEARCYDS